MSKNYPPFRHVFHMQTSDLNVNNAESDHAYTIFLQFQDAIFPREHTYVKTLTKIIFHLLQEIATLSLPKKAAITSFISTTFRGYFCLGANDIARNRSRVIFSRACVDIFRRWSVWLQMIFCTCVKETVLFSFLRSPLRENDRSLRFPRIFIKNKQTNSVIEW